MVKTVGFGGTHGSGFVSAWVAPRLFDKRQAAHFLRALSHHSPHHDWDLFEVAEPRWKERYWLRTMLAASSADTPALISRLRTPCPDLCVVAGSSEVAWGAHVICGGG